MRGWLFGCLRREWPAVAACVAALTCAQGLALLVPLATWLVTDRALPEGSGRLLLLAVLALVVVALHGAVLGACSDLASRTLDQRLRLRANAAIFDAQLRAVDVIGSRRTIGDALQLMASAESVAGAVLGIGLSPAVGLMGACSAGMALYLLAPGPAVALLLTCITFLGVALPLLMANARWQSDVIRTRAVRQSGLVELLQGASTLRAEAAEAAAFRRWLGRLVREQAASLGQDRCGLWLDLLMEGAMQATRVGWLAWGAAACLRGSLSLGAMLAGTMLVEQVMRQVIGLSHAAIAGSGLAIHWKRVDAALVEAGRLARGATPGCPAKAPDSGAPALRVANTHARYEAHGPWVLRDQSLVVPVGALVIVAGQSGAGKTTLLRLAAGLLPCDQGTIAVFGRPARRCDERVGYLPQNASLFEGTLANNLAWISGRPVQDILDAARRTGLDDWVRTLPMGYATRLSSGTGLVSGGQRQLILLTGVLASDRSLLLLDEPMSHLDQAMRKRILESGLFEGRTTVIISHDSPTHRNGTCRPMRSSGDRC